MSRSKTAIALTLTAVTALGLLTGCREEEQGRIRNFEPGVYKGQEDTALDDARLQELRERTRLQAGS